MKNHGTKPTINHQLNKLPKRHTIIQFNLNDVYNW